MPISALSNRTPAPQRAPRPAAAGDRLELLFGSDSHAGYALLDRFVSQANAKQPDLVLFGGDMVERGTAPEHQLTTSGIAKLQVPYDVLPGNHDYKRDELPRFKSQFGDVPRSMDLKGVHLVLLDDAEQTISEDQFKFLESDLAANQGKPTIVAMHVPATWTDTSAAWKATRKVLGDHVAQPALKDPGEARRFQDLMSRYHVGLVLTGHTHLPDDHTVDGVRYVTVGALGGKIALPGTNHEYLDVTVENGQFDVRHVALDNPVTGPINVVAGDASYYLRLREATKDLANGQDGVTQTEGPTGLKGLVQDVEEQAADAVIAASKNPTLAKLGYKAYGAVTKPRKDTPTIDNLSTVTPTLLRGAQPTQQGFASLKAQGVQTVINLRPEANWEEPMVKGQGMQYLYMPLPAVGAPTNDQAIQFLQAVTDPANGKVFIHCQHGADRTGAMVAAYRIAAQGWTADQAIAEMYQNGFHAGFENEKLDFVRRFAKYWASVPVTTRAQVLHRKGLNLTA